MTRREIVRIVLEGTQPPYVPWAFGFTTEAREKLAACGRDDLLRGHLLHFRHSIGFFTDIGVVSGCVLGAPTLKGYTFPDPADLRYFEGMSKAIGSGRDGLRVFNIGFSLYERAWTLRGMENLMLDFIENPGFVRELMGAIADYNIAQIRTALEYDIDAVHFGDDWGQQCGLQMGPAFWREFICPQLKRMYGVVKDAGKFVSIHSCGDVDELFDDLIGIGLNCFNPFQPEVMDVEALLKKYRGRPSTTVCPRRGRCLTARPRTCATRRGGCWN